VTRNALQRLLAAGAAFAEPIAAASATGEPVKTLQLLPIGPIAARDGRKWNIRDAAHAQAIVEASKASAGAAEIPVDYDHQTLFGAKDGVGRRAPASGWLSNLRVDGGFIVADVAWTDAAQAKLKAREYRYFSPVFTFDKASGDVSRILHGALTNFPAITELAAVASADPQGSSMDLKALAKALGLSETATLEECVAAASALQANQTAVGAALKLQAGATGEQIVAAATAAVAAGVPDPSKFAPLSELQAANARIAALETAAVEEKATEAVDQAIASGKLTPANRDWGLGYARKDLAGFGAFIGAAPVVAAAAVTAAAGRVDPESVTLTDEETAFCRSIGLAPEKFLKTKKEEVAHGRA